MKKAALLLVSAILLISRLGVVAETTTPVRIVVTISEESDSSGDVLRLVTTSDEAGPCDHAWVWRKPCNGNDATLVRLIFWGTSITEDKVATLQLSGYCSWWPKTNQESESWPIPSNTLEIVGVIDESDFWDVPNEEGAIYRVAGFLSLIFK